MKIQATGSMKDYKHSSYMSEYPDVPLRVPLEFEYRLNRKMAKKIYQEEK